ncbi:MAG: aminoacyl-tRNA hydrolase [Xanthomonadales bacterium]|nr:aminoacyl-tRNA hydrolase [Gammaproteobacteria bacterium]MBT8053352.1 aminoacyl-tRNA hydrolase [Gammaproteobacteria bacterium]NND58064.1 aminoacyl-tRNA hydrolase [Xanthomonadales bacterium]NNK52161.1 aminoacyl-tRNA hydrolase [Xanthomonadales bacterium]
MPFLIMGLGNPGPGYAETRHNAGFWFMDRVAELASASFKNHSRLLCETARVSLHGVSCILARPTTFMNHSGQSVRAVMDYYRVGAAEMLIAYDELDLPPGIARLKQGGGHGGHNGMRDIFQHTTDQNFLRLRIGIGHPGNRDAVTAYVLSRPAAEQEKLIRHSISDALDTLPKVLAGDLAGAMKDLHTVTENGL